MEYSKTHLIKQRIIQSTIQVMATNGFASTSLATVAQSSGIKQTSLLYHFQNKNNLLTEVINYIILNNYKVVEGKLELNCKKSKFTRYLIGNLEWAKEYPDQSKIILLLYYRSTHVEEYSVQYEKIKKNAQKRISTLIKSNNIELIEILHEYTIGLIINVITGIEKLSKGEISKAENKTMKLLKALGIND